MTNLVTAKTTTIETLPNELLAPIFRLTGQGTCARVSTHWQDVQMINFSSLRNEYSQNPKIRRFMPRTDRPETATECNATLRRTILNVLDYYRNFSNIQPDTFSRKGLIEACDLEELIIEADQQADKNLVTLWNHLPAEIIQQLAALIPYPANATNAQIAFAIRNGIQHNRADIQAILSQVTELSVLSEGLSAIPSEIGLFVNLQTLDLRNNQIISLPPEIGNLVILQRLFLDDNQIRFLPREIGNLVNLTMLSLCGNSITSLLPEIGNLVNLQNLYFNGNQLKTLPSEIGKLKHLQELSLDSNQITFLPAEIGNLENLIVLELSNNQITFLPAEIGKLMSLQVLHLQNNPLSYAARNLIAKYCIQNPACLIKIDP